MKPASILIPLALLVPAVAAAEPASSPSPAGALAWSVGGTLIGVGAVGAGLEADSPVGVLGGQAVLAFGPSAGHFYAGETRHGLIVSGLRAGTIALFDYGVGASFGCGIDDQSTNGCTDGPFAAALIGLAGFTGLTIYDWIDAPRAALREARAGGADVTFAPLALPGRRGVGLALIGRF